MRPVGRGGRIGARVETCAACAGRGRVRFQQALFPIAVERPCSRCRGSGQIPTEACERCQGSGLAKATRRLELTIPPGIESGSVRSVEGAASLSILPSPAYRERDVGAGPERACEPKDVRAEQRLGGEGRST